MKRYFKLRTAIGVIILMFLPVLVVIILTKSTESNDWIGFFGSYIGSILVGIITLVVMECTIESGEVNLKAGIDENKKINKENEIIRFCNEIAYLIGDYCSDISVYYYNCIKVEIYDREKGMLYQRFCRHEITSEEYRNILSILEMNRPRADRSKSTSIYFKLEILLKEEELATTLMETLKKVHNTYDYIQNRLASEENKFEEEIENLLEETRRFIKEYKSNT